LLAGFRWILVDEYQNIGPEQYELIAHHYETGSLIITSNYPFSE
jgi:superfamily I DNA/RNA helicase